MLKFYSNEKAKLLGLIEQFNPVAEKFSRKDYDADMALLQFLNNSIDVYKELGSSERESQLQVSRAEFMTAKRGINPITFEKQLLRRHEMVSTINYKVLQSTGEIIRNDIASKDAILKQAEDLIGQIIIASLQSGILTDEQIKKIKSQQDIEKTWAAIGTNADIQLGQKRVLLQVNRYDAIILFSDLLARFKDP